MLSDVRGLDWAVGVHRSVRHGHEGVGGGLFAWWEEEVGGAGPCVLVLSGCVWYNHAE